MSKEENNFDQDLKKYQNPGSPSLKEMNFGLWLSEKKRLFSRLSFFFWLAAAVFFIGYSLYGFTVYFLQAKGHRELLAEMTTGSGYQVQLEELAAGSLLVFPVNGHYDLAVNVTNQNDRYLFFFDYCFRRGEEDLACGRTFILPSSSKHVLALNQELKEGAGNLSFRITKADWRRINRHDIPDWPQYAAARLNFLASNISFSSAADNSLAGRPAMNRLEFTLSNQGPYSYYEVPVIILLYGDETTLVGVNSYSFSNFKAGTTRSAELSWAGDIGQVRSVKIVPDVNVAEKGIFLNYSGQK